MTPIDAKVIPIIRKNIAKYGKTVRFTVAATAYDPTTGGINGGGAFYDVKVTPPSQYNEADIDGDAIQRDDVKIYVQKDGLLFEPVRQTQVTIDNAQWFVVDIEPIYSGDLVAMYGLQLRK